jgi:hypothetical protein
VQRTLGEWWAHERNRKRGKARKDFDTLVCTISFALWNNRNAFVFGDERRDDITGLSVLKSTT